jgi:hypothetical protein
MAAEWVPAVTAGITALAALGGQAIAGLLQGRNQERVEARQRRQQAAEVLAEARAFLVDASPDRIGINASQERTPEVPRELQERRERIRIPLLTLAGSHPSPHVRRLAQQLEVEMANMLHMAGFLVSDLLGRRAPGAAREQANQHHTVMDMLRKAIEHAQEAAASFNANNDAPEYYCEDLAQVRSNQCLTSSREHRENLAEKRRNFAPLTSSSSPCLSSGFLAQVA